MFESTGDDLAKYRFGIDIDSVHYFNDGMEVNSEPDPEETVGNHLCAVLFRVDFNLRNAILSACSMAIRLASSSHARTESALVPTHVADTSQIDVWDHFPDSPETVKMSERTVADLRSLAPSVQSNAVGVTIGQWSRQEDKKLCGMLHLSAERKPAVKTCDAGPFSVEVHW
jgi:hypothetical protein